MKRWQAAATLLLALLILLFLTAPARAQSFEQLPPVIAAVITKSAVLVDSLLSHWVTGNTLTDPAGKQLVEGIAQTVVNTVHFLAQVVTLF
jgi:hypothetical protein